MTQFGKIIGGIIAIIIGYLMIQITHIIPILSGSFEGMLYSAKFEADGSLPIMILLGLLGAVIIIIGIILLIRGVLSQYQDHVDDMYYQPSRHHPHTRDWNDDDDDDRKSFCPYCGAKLSRGTRFCTACGKRIS